MMGGNSDLKLGRWADRSKCIPERCVVRVTWPTLDFEAPDDISGTAKARNVKFCTQVDCIKS